MPLARLKQVRKSGSGAEMLPGYRREPRDRMLRREMVMDRHVSKRQLREVIDEWPTEELKVES